MTIPATHSAAFAYPGLLRTVFKKEGDMTVGDSKVTTPEKIINCVCKHYNMSLEILTDKKKTQNLVTARQVCSYLLYNYTDMTLLQIAKRLGKKEHSSITHSNSLVYDNLHSRFENEYKEAVKSLLNVIFKWN